ncbi:hypothetical protein BSKO_04652 [Bryopsis sp. KO-2023]|nr:hypothetical protein BSKO_04652 [Bryopsis sp. KO-2023]
MPLSIPTASLLLLSINLAFCQDGRGWASLSLSPRTKTIELLSRFRGCPKVDQSARECPIPSSKKCVSDEQCGKNRVCCPAVPPAVADGCGYCTKKVGCGDLLPLGRIPLRRIYVVIVVTDKSGARVSSSHFQ